MKNRELIEGLWDAPKAYLISKRQVPILLITGGEEKVRISDDLTTLAPKRILELPSWETLPGDDITPSRDLMGRRLSVLLQLSKKKNPIVIAPLQACLQKVAPLHDLQSLVISLKVGEEIAFEKLIEKLESLGYTRAKIAADKGEFAVRGGIIDLFPSDAFDPCRLEFFGDTIEEIRLYDPATQVSTEKISAITIAPADEQQLVEKSSCTLFDYLPPETLIIFDDLVAVEDAYVQLKNLSGMHFGEFFALSKNYEHLYFSQEKAEALSETKRTKTTVEFEIFEEKITATRARHPFLTYSEEANYPNFEITLFVTSEAEKEKIAINAKTIHGYLSSSFINTDTKEIYLASADFTGRHHVRREKWRSSHPVPAAEFHELKEGDLVVHASNGIGRYLGIEKQKNISGTVEEFFIIEYAGNAKLFVPLSQAHLISRYIGVHDESPVLHKIGSSRWAQQRQRTEKSILTYARDLLTLQAKRIAKGGFSYPEDSDDFQLFEEEFPFTETIDQQSSITAIKEDMHSEKAMDRLICGDVGYGKTEVAMRAAAKAVIDGGKQVVVLVPTTILAMQHYENFKERMQSFPINVAQLSRMVKPKEAKKTLAGVKSGEVDILVGTHRLTSKELTFRDLGLLIIDEEQRFGVKVKEHLKKMKESIDCLTLSATPIPRTLYLSLVGARDMSQIHTPPLDRLPIKTIIAEQNDKLIENALLREILRDGQAYFIHNRVETIYEKAAYLEKLVPTARIAVVHGQLTANEIDKAFHRFKNHEIDILVATTLVENGVDIPNANTILIDRSHHFGMADLYQLRGRVGRWNRPAFCYLLIPKNGVSETSRERLTALIASSGYGGGMKLAMRDLEIRGAGDILGTSQAGFVTSVGFHLYCKMLKKAIKALQEQRSISFIETKMEFGIPAFIPESYIDDSSLRLEIYHRLGDIASLKDVDNIYSELQDRFGKPPEPVTWLYHMTRLRYIATERKYTLLKFEKFTLIAHKQEAKKLEKFQYPLPKTKDPVAFEQAITALIR